jgi:hypothetical protein
MPDGWCPADEGRYRLWPWRGPEKPPPALNGGVLPVIEFLKLMKRYMNTEHFGKHSVAKSPYFSRF